MPQLSIEAVDEPAAFIVVGCQCVELPEPLTDFRSLKTATHDFEARADEELGLAVGDEIEVLEQPDGGWWRGECVGCGLELNM